MDWIKIFELFVTVIAFLAFVYQLYRFTKTKDVCEGIWAILLWVALMTIS